MTIGIPNPDRAVDVLNAVAFLSYRLDDAEGARAAWRRAIEVWRAWPDASPFKILEKDDCFAFYLELLLGERVGRTPQAAPDGHLQAARFARERRLTDDLQRQRRAGNYARAIQEARAVMAMAPPLDPKPGHDTILCFYLYQVDGPLGGAADALLLGDLLWEAGRRGEARAAYRPALALFPGDARLAARLAYGPRVPLAEERMRQARRLLDRGEVRAARAHVDRLLREMPRHAEIQALAGDLLTRSGDYPRALGHYTAARRLAPGNFRFAAAEMEAALAVRPAWALPLARRLSARFPDAPSAHAYLAQALVMDALQRPQRPDLSEALRASEQACKGTPSGDVLATRAEALYLAGRRSEAETVFQDALRARLGDPEREIDVLNALGWLRFQAGDVDGMRGYLHQALDRVRRETAQSHERMRPRWESYQTYLAVLGGEDVPVARLLAMQPIYERLRAAGMVDQPLYDFSRTFLIEVARLRAAGRLSEAIARVERFRRAPDPPQTAPERMFSFYSEIVEEAQDRFMVLMLLGDMCRDARRLEAARGWYRLAQRRLPGNPVVGARLDAP
ncbi:MAG: tetratricopeptide repeat protein [Armatimonadetes bacterium]|nr:tetratricopeptide repeat protein [Armatimonadota bacterium]